MSHDTPSIRHIPYATGPGGPVTGKSFGDQYVTRNTARYPLLADQFDVIVFPEGDRNLPPADPMFGQPHIRIRVLTDDQWVTRSRTPIGK